MTPEAIVRAACRAAEEIANRPPEMQWDGWEPALYLPDRVDKIAMLLPVVLRRGARIEGIMAVADVLEAARDWIRSRRISIPHDHRLLPEQLRAHRALRRLRREKGDLRRLYIDAAGVGDTLDSLIDDARHCPGPLPEPTAPVHVWIDYLRDYSARVWPVLFGGSFDDCDAEDGRKWRNQTRHEREQMKSDLLWDGDPEEYLDADLDAGPPRRSRFAPCRLKDPRDWPKMAASKLRSDARQMRAPERAAEEVIREFAGQPASEGV